MSTNITSILYVGKRKHRDRAKKILTKGVQLGFAEKPDNSANLFMAKRNTSVKSSRKHKPPFSIPCGLFMTDDAVLPIRLSKLVPVIVLVRNNYDRHTHLFYKGRVIF